MSSDLIFSVLPREGKEPIAKDEHKVEQVSKEAKLRRLNDEEKELNAEEREAREKYQSKEQAKQKKESAKKAKPVEATKNPLPEVDEHGRKHVDFYI